MIKSRPQPPWEFLASASRNTLQSYELSRLGHASNLRKEILELLDQYLEENTSAQLARLILTQGTPEPPPARAEENAASPNAEALRAASYNIFEADDASRRNPRVRR